jgi:hypothetical protein
MTNAMAVTRLILAFLKALLDGRMLLSWLPQLRTGWRSGLANVQCGMVAGGHPTEAAC